VSTKLRVYGTTLMVKEVVHRNKQARCVVAAASLKEAARLFEVSLYHARGYCSETGNAEELRQALAHPGVVWWHELDEYQDVVWHERKPA
jgi:hypothetical protein